MLNIPEEIKTLLKTDSVRKNFRVHFPNGERADIINDNIISESVVLNESICSRSTLQFGLCETPRIEFECFGIENIKGKTIECSLEIYCPSTVTGAVYQSDLDAYVYPIPYGRFIVDSCVKQADMTRRKVTAPSSFDFNQMKEKVPLRSYSNNYYAPSSATEYVFDVGAYVSAIMVTESDLAPLENYYPEPGYNAYYDYTNITIADVGTYEGQTCSVKIYRKHPVLGSMSGLYTYFAFKPNLCAPLMLKVAEAKATYPGLNLDSAFSKLFSRGYVLHGLQYYNGTNLYNETNKVVSTEYSDKPFDSIMVSLHNAVSAISFSEGYNYIFYDREQLAIPYRFEIIKGTTTIYDSGNYDDDCLALTKNLRNEQDVPYISFNVTSTPKKLTFVKEGGTATVNKNVYLYDFSELLDFDMRTILESYCEFTGQFGNITRDGSFELLSIAEHFATPNAGTLTKSMQKSVWYEDFYSKPIGRLSCTFKNLDNEQETAYKDIVDDYQANRYRIYDVSNNLFIRGNNYSSSQIQQILDDMSEHISSDIVYMPANIECVGLPYIECGDVFEVSCDEGNFVSLVEKRTLSGIMSLTDSYESEDSESSEASGAASSASGGTVIAPGLNYTVLWTNPNIGSNFSAQTITLSESVNNFDYIGIIATSGASANIIPMVTIPKGYTQGVLALGGQRNTQREITDISGNQITFGNGVYFGTYGSSTTTTSNSSLRPYQVIGFKQA